MKATGRLIRCFSSNCAALGKVVQSFGVCLIEVFVAALLPPWLFPSRVPRGVFSSSIERHPAISAVPLVRPGVMSWLRSLINAVCQPKLV